MAWNVHSPVVVKPAWIWDSLLVIVDHRCPDKATWKHTANESKEEESLTCASWRDALDARPRGLAFDVKMKTARQRIIDSIHSVAREENVTILYVCESGSRAWGFPSADSDYDVRFIYLRPTRWYLTTQQKRDVIERPIDDELDISGWDLPKALQLLRKSNPPLLEWLQSPIIYHETSTLRRRLRPLMRQYYSPISCMYHYLHMAENNYRKYLQGDQVWTKKYFYVLRPVLACLWIEMGLGVVPIEFGKLVEKTVSNKRLYGEIDKLLRRKMAGEELDQGPRNKIVSDFLDKQMKRLRADIQPQPASRDPEALDRVFIDLLIENNGKSIEHVPPRDGLPLRGCRP